jgi:hypothetical protein
MARTTLDLDASVLRELKRRKRESGLSIGELASQLLAHALNQPTPTPSSLPWRSRRMGARVDLEDKEALQRLLDRS